MKKPSKTRQSDISEEMIRDMIKLRLELEDMRDALAKAEGHNESVNDVGKGGTDQSAKPHDKPTSKSPCIDGRFKDKGV